MPITTAVGQKSAHSSPRAVPKEPAPRRRSSQNLPLMIVLPMNCLMKGKKKNQISEWKVNSAYCTNPLKMKGCLVENKLHSYPRSRKIYPHRRNLDGGNRLFMKQNRETLTDPLQCLLQTSTRSEAVLYQQQDLKGSNGELLLAHITW